MAVSHKLVALQKEDEKTRRKWERNYSSEDSKLEEEKVSVRSIFILLFHTLFKVCDLSVGTSPISVALLLHVLFGILSPNGLRNQYVYTKPGKEAYFVLKLNPAWSCSRVLLFAQAPSLAAIVTKLTYSTKKPIFARSRWMRVRLDHFNSISTLFGFNLSSISKYLTAVR